MVLQGALQEPLQALLARLRPNARPSRRRRHSSQTRPLRPPELCRLNRHPRRPRASLPPLHLRPPRRLRRVRRRPALCHRAHRSRNCRRATAALSRAQVNRIPRCRVRRSTMRRRKPGRSRRGVHAQRFSLTVFRCRRGVRSERAIPLSSPAMRCSRLCF